MALIKTIRYCNIGRRKILALVGPAFVVYHRACSDDQFSVYSLGIAHRNGGRIEYRKCEGSLYE